MAVLVDLQVMVFKGEEGESEGKAMVVFRGRIKEEKRPRE